MALLDVDLVIDSDTIPDEIDEFLLEANERVRDYQAHSRVKVSGFVPCDFAATFRCLRAIVRSNLAPGDVFCEWGSGFGVVASLAAMLEFEAYGIEIEAPLVDAARDLADAFDLPVEFIHGSFVPEGADAFAERETTNEIFWLVTDADDAYDELGFGPQDLDVVFAYPWPGEDHVIANLFDRHAAAGALLLTYGQLEGVRVRRKVVN